MAKEKAVASAPEPIVATEPDIPKMTGSERPRYYC